MSSADDASRSSAADVGALLDEPGTRAPWRRPLVWVGIALLAAAIAGLWFWQVGRRAAAAPSFVTEPVVRGTLVVTVGADGTLQPTRSVNIGSELSGTVSRVYVDVNDPVKQGQVLLDLDTAKLRDQIVRSRAAVASAEAKVAQTVATLTEAQGNLGRLEEVARLSGGKVPSQSELDTARATLQRARADEASAHAGVADARAALSTDETNLSKASIRAPIDGVVLTRSVDPGNAVAASLQAVTLFTLAADLKQLQLEVNVDETDVGMVRAGQHATFTVGAYLNRRYPATVTRVAYGSTTTDNVVTYTTLLDVDNQDLSLRPGMTATATIQTSDRSPSLLVPNTALRFTPTLADASAPTAAAASNSSSLVARLVPRIPRGTASRGAAVTGGGTRKLWLLRDGRPVAIDVTAGLSDGRRTEVSGAGLAAGDSVIVDQRGGAAAS